MTYFWSSPFSLPVLTVVKAKVLSHNALGWSAASPVNTGVATIQTVPS